MPFGWLQSITQSPYLWWTYHLQFTSFWFTTTFSGTQLGRKTRAVLIFFHAVPNSLKCSPPAEFPHQNLSAPLPNTCNTTRPPISHLDLITWMIFGGDYKPHNSTLCYFLQPSITSSLLGPRMSLSILFPVFIALRSKYLPQYPTTITPTIYYFIVLRLKCLPHQPELEYLEPAA